ncbi:ISWI chromatin-remodeling complex ATPase ISW2 [Sparassis crispa]|uniref:ISWI chromatin-remodeling complex ATPase ISW2 n=1 Tax=Sparassis crispa TaxID=139825 RepID=A0A401GYP8_9APHY|nr:ISWI chromatin-remodeling complex ATPase ISW2 [Sparassis crispa]GBE87288.1 ISWI chromatin-remodeling complex ATPase ISW2 [Sparassis crispa]
MADFVDLTVIDDDELDLLTPTSATLNSSVASATFYSDSSSSENRALRPRVVSTPSTLKPEKQKRKRTWSVSGLENENVNAKGKRSKLEDRKVLTITVNAAKVSAETARRRWLHRYRDLFIPLLPKSTFFDNLRKEVEASRDKTGHVPLHEITEQPKLVKGGQMKDYQLHGLSFLAWMFENGMNCILGDEMGLGKTLQTLSLFAYIKENARGTMDPHLVVCPLSVLPSWLAEAARWVPSLRALRFHGQQSERSRLKEGVRAGNIKFDICVTTYESYVAEDSWFKSRRWTYCVLDEGHKIKNADTQVAGKLQRIGAIYRLILTGTPVQNNLVELWCILHWLYPTVFTDASERLFKDSFDLSRGLYSLPFLKAAEGLLTTVMLRRTKAAVELSVPPCDELTVFVPMTEAQRFWTYRLLTRMDSVELDSIFTTKLEDAKENEGRKEVQAHLAAQITHNKTGEQNQWKKLMNLLMQLRKVCDHPYLLPDAEPDPFVIGEHLVASSSKLTVIDKILADTLPKGERVLIFSQWTNMLDLLEDFMALRSIPYARLDGSTTRPRRALDIKLFQQEKSPYQVFLISTKAGGLGINLTKASTVIMVDCDWNPQNDLQAIARAHRIGQTKTVKVYRLICRGSVEDQMLDRIRRKLFLSLKVMAADGSSSDEQNSALKTSELLQILKKGSSALSQNNDAMDLPRFLEAPIQEILDASRERDDLRAAKVKKLEGETVDQKLVKDAEEEERRLLSGIAQVQSRLFEGKLVTQPRQNKDIAREWKELQKRSRSDRIVLVDGMEMIAAHMGPEVVSAIAKPVAKRQRKKFDSEDWCIYCRDGGELVLCNSCPRVFHASCHGLSKEALHRSMTIACSQHSCTQCGRSTADAGGMLFRCQTCPQAFCEDCLPDGEIDAVGATLPEFVLLGYGESTSAYYIRCHDCHKLFEEEPHVWAQWQLDMQDVQNKLDALPQS